MEINELKWVLWHEFTHVLNYDVVTMTVLEWFLNTVIIYLSRTIANLIASSTSESWKESFLGWITYFFTVILLELFFWLLASIILA